MTISERIMNLAASAVLAGVVMWAYAGICMAYAVDCY
jgi:hypothetical protein